MTDEAQSEQPKGKLELKNTSLKNEREALLALKAVRAGNTVDDVEIGALRENGEERFKEYHGITDPEQVEPQQRQGEKPSPSRLASEMFGDEFKGEVVEAAEGESQQQQADQPDDAGAATADSDTAPRWTDRDLQDLGHHQQQGQQIAAAGQQWMVDYESFVRQYGNVDLNQLEQTDRARAQQIRSDANTLAQRKNQLIAADQQWTANSQTIRQAVTQRTLAADRQKLYADFPEIANRTEREKVIVWGVEQGFERERIVGATDLNAVRGFLRMYRAAHPKKAPPPVPLPKRKRKGGKRSVPQGRASNFARADDEQLRQRMHHGSIEAALELMGRKNERRARR